MPVGVLQVDFGLQLDPLSMCFVLLITGVGSLIHIYSVGYMAHDPERRRFFAYLNLFVAAMLLLVLADNYLGLYIGWEGVGLASYLLIGFWSYKPSAAAAAKKAFVVNRVGDMGLAIALMVMFAARRLGHVRRVFSSAPPWPTARSPPSGCCCCSARAARAPRCRCSPGSATRWRARHRCRRPDPRRDDGDRRRVPDRAFRPDLQRRARRADRRGDRRRGDAAVRRDHRLRQGRHQEGAGRLDDVARSATWCWPPGLGPAGYAVAIMHLLTHGFFKAGLFLGAGSVMHAMDDEIDMRRYGGLRKLLPITFVTFGLGYLAIIGVPPFAGFFSKDAIIETAWRAGGLKGWLLGGAALLGAGITAFYMTRVMLMTFFGGKRWTREASEAYPHESPPVMTWPMIVLAVGSVGAGGVLAIGGTLQHWLEPVVGAHESRHAGPRGSSR